AGVAADLVRPRRESDGLNLRVAIRTEGRVGIECRVGRLDRGGREQLPRRAEKTDGAGTREPVARFVPAAEGDDRAGRRQSEDVAAEEAGITVYRTYGA